MPSIGHRTGSIAVALVAAWLLVLQSVFGALAFGSSPQAAQLDAFGNIICTHDGAAELPAGDPHQQTVPPCCALGCLLSGAAFSPPPAVFALAGSIVYEAVAFAIFSVAPVPFPREHTAANPRAPPLTA